MIIYSCSKGFLFLASAKEVIHAKNENKKVRRKAVLGHRYRQGPL